MELRIFERVKKGEQGGAVSVYVSQRVVLETSKTKVVA
jgi:hypothetical protein